MSGIEFTTVGGWAPDAARRDEQIRAERREALADEQRRRPDASVYGVVCPFNVELDDGKGNRITFTPETRWHHTGSVPLKLEHNERHLGYAIPIVETNGLVIQGVIGHRSRDAIGDRQHLSVGLGPYQCRERDDGVLEVTDATLLEVSIVRTPRWPDHCFAAIWRRAA